MSVAFLGHIISSEGVEVDPRKMEAVKNWPRLFTPTNIRSFFGLTVYYRRLVDDFAYVASPLTTLTIRLRSLTCRKHVIRDSKY